jgi:hypothetical protein
LRKFGAISHCCHCHYHHHCSEPFLTAAIATANATITSSKPVCITFDRTNRWALLETAPRNPWEHKPAQPLGRLTPPKKTLNNKQQTVI